LGAESGARPGRWAPLAPGTGSRRAPGTDPVTRGGLWEAGTWLERRNWKETGSRAPPGFGPMPSPNSVQEILLRPDAERIGGWMSSFSFLWHAVARGVICQLNSSDGSE